MTFEAVTYESIPHALVSGIIISILCSAVGLFLVLRRYSLFGDALAHSAFGGVAFGLFIGVYPLWIACIVAILSALGLTKIRQKFDISSDAIVAILFATGLGAGVILISMSDDLDLHDIEEFLFGSAIIDTQECNYNTCNGWCNSNYSFLHIQEIIVFYIFRGAGQGLWNPR